MYYVYILASKYNGTPLYISITNDLVKRVYQHKNKLIKGFTAKYNVNNLVYYEESVDIISAITREKQLKVWQREWKIKLINQHNPTWSDLSQNGFLLTTVRATLE